MFLTRPTATLDVEMEEIGGGGTDIRPMQIVLVFDAGGNCISDTALMMLLRLVGRLTPGRAPRGDTLQSTNGRMG